MNYSISLDMYSIFMEVYENKSLTKVAEKLNLTQPTISYRIRTLENLVDTKLFNRTSKGMETTSYADELYISIKEALENLRVVERNIFEKRQKGIGNIYIGVQHHISKYYLTPIVKKYNERYPNVKIHIINKGTSELVELLESGKVDFLIDTLPISGDKKQLKIIKIKELETCLCKIKDAPEKYIFPIVGSTMRVELDKVLQSKEISIEPDFEIYTTEMTIEMIKQGIGIGYTIKDFLLQDIEKDVEYVDVGEKLPKLTLAVAYVNCKQPMLVENFVNMIERFGKCDIY